MARRGSKFLSLEESLSHRKHPPRDPKAVAAAIGREKYGESRFEDMAQAGRRKVSIHTSSGDVSFMAKHRSHRKGRKPKGHKAGCKCVVCRRR